MNKFIQHPSKVLGVLILVGIIIGVFSVAPSVEHALFLELIYPNKVQIYWASFFQLLLVPIYMGYALVFYSLLNRGNNTLLQGFLGFRFLASAFQLVGAMILPLLILLSKEYLMKDTENNHEILVLGNLLRNIRDFTNHIGVIFPICLGNMLLYIVLRKDKFIPNWLSFWGLAANGLLILSTFLLIGNFIKVVSIAYAVFSLPLVLQEVFLAVFLLTRKKALLEADVYGDLN
jgi:hypothetical protein